MDVANKVIRFREEKKVDLEVRAAPLILGTRWNKSLARLKLAPIPATRASANNSCLSRACCAGPQPTFNHRNTVVRQGVGADCLVKSLGASRKPQACHVRKAHALERADLRSVAGSCSRLRRIAIQNCTKATKFYVRR